MRPKLGDVPVEGWGDEPRSGSYDARKASWYIQKAVTDHDRSVTHLDGPQCKEITLVWLYELNERLIQGGHRKLELREVDDADA